jgi:hypothetical protein
MKNMIQMKITIGSTNNSFTNAINVHTCPTCSTNLIRPVVLVMYDELAKFIGNVICCAGVGVPVAVTTILMVGGVRVLLLGDIVGVKAMPTGCSTMPLLEADLAPPIEARLE